MQFKKIKAVAVVIALVASQVAVISLAHAGAYLTLNSFSGTPGTILNVTGGGWTAGDTIDIYVGAVSGTPAATATVGNDTTISTNVTVPVSEMQGPLPIIGVDTMNSFQATNSFYVNPLSPAITVTAASHTPFSTVSVNGTGYGPNETVTLTLGSASSTATADGTGSFSGTIVIPPVNSGLYLLIATGNVSHVSSLNYFWVDQFYSSVSPSTYYIMPGGTLSFSGSGFAAGETIDVTQTGSSTVLSTLIADGSGSFTAQGGFAVPASYHGTIRNFTLTGTESHSTASVGVTIGDFYPYASPSTYYLLPGQSLTFTGGGFAANESVNVFLGKATTSVAQFMTDANGNFTNAGSVAVPFGSSGDVITYNLVGASSGVTTSASTAVGSYYPSISPSNYYAVPNSSITISGAGFAPNETVALSVNNATSTSAMANASGTFSAPVTIPFSKTGGASIVATGASSGATTSVGVSLASFYPSVTPSIYYLFPGQSIYFDGTGFAPNETVTISSNLPGATSTSVNANASGGFVTPSMTVPYSANSLFTTTFTGNLSGATTQSSVAVGSLFPYLTADSYSTAQGQTVHVTGFGFGTSENVQVTAGMFATTTSANASGETAAVAIPTPYGTSTLPVVFTGASTHVTTNLSIGLTGYVATLSSNNYYTQPGTQVTITGAGFAPNESVMLAGGVTTSTISANASGTFTAPVTLPLTIGASNVTITGTGLTSGASASVAISFAPYTPQISPSTWFTTPGTNVQFTGTGFAPNEIVTATLNGTAIASTTASAGGTFTYNHAVPFGSSQAAFVFKGTITQTTFPITITLSQYYASIQLSTYYAEGGSPLTITGSGYAPSEPINLYFMDAVFASSTANTNGMFTYNGTVPFSPSGTGKTINAVGVESGATGASTITIAPIYVNLQLGTYAGKPGSAVNFIGSGYLPNEPISVTTDRTGTTTVYMFNADANGNFNNSGYHTPTSFTEGNLVLTVTGQHSLAPESITYYVTGD